MVKSSAKVSLSKQGMNPVSGHLPKLDLHSIFCHLVSDDTFLSTIIEEDQKEIEQKKNKLGGFNLMANLVTEYLPLAPYEMQQYSLFPSKIKSFLSPDYVRFGIKNVIEKDFNIINISFLNSLNMLLRPDLYRQNIDDHIKNLNLLENFVKHKIDRNYHIDKTKRTRKVQGINKELIKNLSDGKISHALIEYVVNIFEINLLVFDLVKLEIYFYWTSGHKHPYLNFFRNLHCMAYVQGNYEPIMSIEKVIPREQIQKIYLSILNNPDEIKCLPPINLSVQSLIVLDSWNINPESYVKILEQFFNKPQDNFDANWNELQKIELSK